MINILEIIMVICSFVYSLLMLKCKRSSFIFGIIATTIMTYTFVTSKIYIQAILNLVYATTYVYSYFSWGRKENNLKISNISIRTLTICIMFVVIFTAGLGCMFDTVEAKYPYLDAFSTACSIVAVVLLSRKIIQNSYVFLLSNIATIAICYMTKDYFAIISFVIYMIFNTIRIYTWKNIKEKEEQI